MGVVSEREWHTKWPTDISKLYILQILHNDKLLNKWGIRKSSEFAIIKPLFNVYCQTVP